MTSKHCSILFIVTASVLLQAAICYAQTHGGNGGSGGGGSSGGSGSSGAGGGSKGGGLFDIIFDILFNILFELLFRLVAWIFVNTFGRLFVYLWTGFCGYLPGPCGVIEYIVSWLIFIVGWCAVFVISLIALAAFFPAFEPSIRSAWYYVKTKARKLKMRIKMLKFRYIHNQNSRKGLELPSGTWAGFYREQRVEFQMWNVLFTFTDEGEISGNGRDGLSEFVIKGTYSKKTNECVFFKTYKGQYKHTILCEGRIFHRGGGFRGTWYNKDDEGRFGYWPVMNGWNEPNEIKTSVKSQLGIYKATDNSECIVCFDNDIDCVLRPCGHIAICSDCVSKLRSKTCPVCRTNLEFVTQLSEVENGILAQ